MSIKELEVTLKMLDIYYWYNKDNNICICSDIFDDRPELHELINELLIKNKFTYDIIEYSYNFTISSDFYIYKIFNN